LIYIGHKNTRLNQTIRKIRAPIIHIFPHIVLTNTIQDALTNNQRPKTNRLPALADTDALTNNQRPKTNRLPALADTPYQQTYK
jgi:hypothetical protein